ncbi:MAG: hypothetical protein OEM50_01610 [Gammaproteobacteria bacterium]|nr:hypothetical protein [Gammaproteobacteria bacterium]MDH3480383.1 hypothetical protein [Gammaproteobacteria bacterium]
MKTRKCNQCGEVKSLSLFPKDRAAAGGYRAKCKDCVSIRDKEYRSRNKEKIKQRQHNYYVRNKKHLKKKRLAYEDTAEGVWAKVVSQKTNGKHQFDLTKEDFTAWYEAQDKVCVYCGCDIQQTRAILKELSVSRRSNRLQIDRMRNEEGYTLENIVLACPICNYHKGWFFTFEQFSQIAATVLKPKFLKILMRVNSRQSDSDAGLVDDP